MLTRHMLGVGALAVVVTFGIFACNSEETLKVASNGPSVDQSASSSVSVAASKSATAYASSGVLPPRLECGLRVL